MSHAEPVSRRLWSDGFFARVPLPPALFGVLVAAGLVGLLAVLAVATGAFDRLAVRHLAWWQSRDGRIAVLVALLAGTVPAAMRYHELGTRRNLDALASANLWPSHPPALLSCATSGSPRTAIAWGVFGALQIPVIAYTVDRDPDLYFTARYWWLGPIWTWIVGMLVAFMAGILTYRIITDARKFAGLARALPPVDLLERDALLPFARQGLRSAVPGVIFVTFFALNLGDAGFQFASWYIMAAVLAQNAAVLVLPMRGVHERLRAAKYEEIARVNAAIRGEPDALSGSPLGKRDRLALADLLAWRAFVEAVPEWPIDISTLSRSLLYVVIPLLGWIGSALVQHVLESALSYR
jgi:hypothetical protein